MTRLGNCPSILAVSDGVWRLSGRRHSRHCTWTAGIHLRIKPRRTCCVKPASYMFLCDCSEQHEFCQRTVLAMTS